VRHLACQSDEKDGGAVMCERSRAFKCALLKFMAGCSDRNLECDCVGGFYVLHHHDLQIRAVLLASYLLHQL
jgi:hypothetical protein